MTKNKGGPLAPALAILLLAVVLFAIAVETARGARDNAWLTRAFLCIHSHEAAWNARTGNGYYGGLQMDYDFMRAYGSAHLARYGTADRWPVKVQLAVAMRAYRDRGFQPWPNTARLCGLR